MVSSEIERLQWNEEGRQQATGVYPCEIHCKSNFLRARHTQYCKLLTDSLKLKTDCIKARVKKWSRQQLV